jgi:hypothetical protein
MPASWLYFGDGRPWTWVGYVRRSPAALEAEARAEAVERVILDWAKALRARYRTCGKGPLDCGGNCSRIEGHEPEPCWCEGVDENGEETCPA